MDSNFLFREISQQVANLRNLGCGCVSNIFFDQTSVDLWVADNQPISHYWHPSQARSLFVLRHNEGFYNLYFASTDQAQLSLDLGEFLAAQSLHIPVVVDLVGRDNDMPALLQAFESNNFSQYCSLVRMSRAVSEDEPRRADIIYAQKEQAQDIDELLCQHFDPLCEQLPTLRQIEQWTENKRILLRKIDGKIAGFLIFEINGVTSYLRYWFTHPDYRNQMVGSSLLRQFFAESNATKRQIFWVIESNDNAVVRYRHYGFDQENMFDKVLILKPQHL